jgi:hypothetical protein
MASLAPNQPAKPRNSNEAEHYIDSELYVPAPVDYRIDDDVAENSARRQAGIYNTNSVTDTVKCTNVTLNWWKQQSDQGTYPNLSRMARDILAVQAHSVGAERSFSQARGQVTSIRSRMTAETIKESMIVKHWSLKELQAEIIAEGELEETVTKRAIFDSIAVEQDVLDSMGLISENTISDTDETDMQDVGWKFFDTDGERALERQPIAIFPNTSTTSFYASKRDERGFLPGSNSEIVDEDAPIEDQIPPDDLADIDSLPISVRQRIDDRLGTSYTPGITDFASDASSEWSSDDETESVCSSGGSTIFEDTTLNTSINMEDYTLEVPVSPTNVGDGGEPSAIASSMRPKGRKRLSGSNRTSPGKKVQH